MKTLEKIKKGSDYLIDQTEKKLNTLGVIEGSTFTPTNPKEFKKYKANAEFRLTYVEEVRTLSIEYIKICALMNDLVAGVEFGNDEMVWPRNKGSRKVRILQKHAVYGAMVEAMDLAVGKVLDKLKSLGLDDEVVVAFTSDQAVVARAAGD